ncbi:Uncharacterised protein [uncultured archaeon]|nr:Uncharacterised protein [uncultured archaeon]
MSSKKILTIIIICTAIAFSAGIAGADDNPPSLPVMLYGNVIIDGNPAPVGVTITAKAGTSQAGATNVLTAGTYGDKPNGRLPISANDGANVDFYVNGIKATPSIQFTYHSNEAGKIIRVDLSANSGTSSSSGSSSGGSGGGSGSGIKPTTTVPQSTVPPIKSAVGVTGTKEPQVATTAAPSTTGPAFNFYMILGVFAVVAVIGVTLKKWGKI